MKKILLLVIISALCISASYAEENKSASKPMGLTVEPGGLLVQNVPIGVTYDFTKEVGIPLTIYNRDNRPHTYILSTDKPSKVGSRKWLKGYLEIPNPSWVWPEEKEIRIEANSSGKVNLYMKIPPAEKYYNQHWAVSLGVKGKPEAGQMFALAAHPRMEIETLSKLDPDERPSGILAILPSTAIFKGVSLGKKEKIALTIFNNGDKTLKYKITPVIFPKDPKKRQIFPTPKYSWIPDTGWIKPKPRYVAIKPHEEKELTLEIMIPNKKEHYNRFWEAILFADSKKGPPAFARVQIETEKIKGNED